MIHGDPSLPYLNLTVHRAPAWRTQRPGWWRTVLAAALAGSGAAAIAAEPARGGDEIEGAWQVVSVEFAGQPLPGLEGARLVLLRGRKTFTLLSGATEEGTYALDPTRELKWMDSTTGGRTSTTLHNLYKRRGAMLASFAELMPFNDLVAVSY